MYLSIFHSHRLKFSQQIKTKKTRFLNCHFSFVAKGSIILRRKSTDSDIPIDSLKLQLWISCKAIPLCQESIELVQRIWVRINYAFTHQAFSCICLGFDTSCNIYCTSKVIVNPVHGYHERFSSMHPNTNLQWRPIRQAEQGRVNQVD